MSGLGRGRDGADAKVRGVCKSRVSRAPQRRHRRRKGHPVSLGGAGFFCRWVLGYRRDGRQKLGGGVSSLKILSAGSWGLVNEECKWWVR